MSAVLILRSGRRPRLEGWPRAPEPCDDRPAHPRARPRRRLVPGAARGHRDRGAAPEPAGAALLAVPRADLPGVAVRQVRVLRAAGAVDRPDLGLLRHPLAR